jgi:hypothetical protein
MALTVITQKAQAIVDNVVASEGGSTGPQATGIGGPILQTIITIILQLLGSGGLGFCKPPAARVYQIVTSPNRRHRRIRDDVIEQNLADSPALVIPVKDAFDSVTSTLTEADTTQMYQEANP